ncbi:MAG TPA: hypothetical protein VHM31_03755 [Polyangia bacterium]|nr:hypothetical protein [Polyangia bacterium]
MGNPRFVDRALVLSAVGWVLVTGCTSSTPPTQTTAGSKPLSTKLAQAYCARQAACCTSAPAASDAGAAADGGAAIPCPAIATADAGAEECLGRAQLAADQQLALVGTAYAEGLIGINQAVVADCVAAYQTRACNAVLDVDDALADPACAGLFTGYIPRGYRCDTTVECVTGTYCLAQETGRRVTSLAGGGTLGVCFPYQDAGAPCNTTADCAPPFTCGATTGVCQ